MPLRMAPGSTRREEYPFERRHRKVTACDPARHAIINYPIHSLTCLQLGFDLPSTWLRLGSHLADV